MIANNVVINGQSYAQIQTVLPVDATIAVDPLNGRQGDNQRDVYIQLLGQGDRPRPLKGGSVDLVGRDSEDIIKQTNTAVIINDRQGLVRIDVPKQFYQAAGDYESAFLRIHDDTGKVVSSIGVTMTVVHNELIISQSESTMYLKTVDDIIQSMSQKVEDAEVMAKAAQDAAHALTTQIASYVDLVEKNAAARLGVDNTWTGKQTFGDIDVNGTLTANKLAGQAMDDINSSINAIASTLTGDGWNQNYTLTNGASRAADNQYYIQQFTAGKLRIIAGVGKIHVPAIKNGQKFTIMYPYNFGRGSVVLGSVFQAPSDFDANFQAAEPNGSGIEIFNTNATANTVTDMWFNTLVVAY